jgi:phage N-6-adenine-methyltransferase
VSLVARAAKNHPQQVGRRGANPAVDDRATSPEVFGPLHDRFHFSIDVAASATNTKCERFYTVEDDGLAQPWSRERVWCNPPYSDIRPWVRKAWSEWAGTVECPGAALIVMLVPANRTEQGWWQESIEAHRDRDGSPLRTEFLSGRLRFIAPGADSIGPNERPPFGCVLLVWSMPS